MERVIQNGKEKAACVVSYAVLGGGFKMEELLKLISQQNPNLFFLHRFKCTMSQKIEEVDKSIIYLSAYYDKMPEQIRVVYKKELTRVVQRRGMFPFSGRFMNKIKKILGEEE